MSTNTKIISSPPCRHLQNTNSTYTSPQSTGWDGRNILPAKFPFPRPHLPTYISNNCWHRAVGENQAGRFHADPGGWLGRAGEERLRTGCFSLANRRARVWRGARRTKRLAGRGAEGGSGCALMSMDSYIHTCICMSPEGGGGSAVSMYVDYSMVRAARRLLLDTAKGVQQRRVKASLGGRWACGQQLRPT